MRVAFRKKALRLALLAAAVSIVLLLVAGFTLRRADVQNWLLSRLWYPSKYHVRMQVTGLDLSGGIGVSAQNFILTIPNSPPVTAARVHVSFRLSALLKGQLIPDRIDLHHLYMELADGQKATFHPLQALGKIWPYLGHLRRVHVNDAEVFFKERACRLVNLEANLSRTAPDQNQLRLEATTVVKYRQHAATCKISALAGKNQRAPGSLWIQGKLTTRMAPFAWLPKNRFLTFANGTTDIRLQFSAATDAALTIKAQATANRLDFVLTKGSARKAYHLKQPVLKIHLRADGHNIKLPAFALQSKRLHLTGNAAFGIQNDDTAHLSLTVQSPGVALETVKAIFPSPLLPTWYQTRLLPLFTSGQVRIDAFRLDGTLNQLAHLNRRPNRSHLALALTLKDMQAFKPVLPLAFEKASGRLMLADGKLNITQIHGMFGRSVIHDAAYRIPDLYARPVIEIIDLKGRFTLEDLKKLRQSNLLSTGQQDPLQQIEPISGIVEGQMTLHVHHWNLAPTIAAAHLQFKNCRINWKPLELTFSIEHALLALSDTGKWQYHGQGLWQNSPFDFSGGLDVSPAAGHMEVKSQTDWQAILVHFGNPWGIKLAPHPSGSSRFQVSWKPAGWRVIADTDLSGAGIRAPFLAVNSFQSGSRLSLDISSHDKHLINIRQAVLISGTTSLHMAGNFSITANPSVHLELQTDYFSLQELGLHWVSADLPAAGIFSGRISIDAPLQNLSHTAIRGDLMGEKVALPAGAFPLPVNAARFALTFSDRQVHIGLLRLPVNGNPVFIKGTVRLQKPLTGTLSVTADTLDLSPWLRNTPKQNSPAGGYFDQTELKLHIRADKLRLKAFTAGPLLAVCTYRNKNITIDSATIRLAHGTIHARGEYTPGYRPAWHLYTNAQLTKQPIAQLLTQIGMCTDRFDGLATLMGVFSTRGNSWPELVSSLNGKFNLWVETGIIRRSSIVVKVLDFLSLKNILDKRPDSAAGGGVYFEELQNKSTLKNGILSLDYFKMRSPIFNALASGTIDLPRGSLNIDLDTQPLGTIDTLVSYIPIVGHILTGKAKTILVYRFKIGGNIRKPEITYQPFKHMGKSTLAYFRRMLLTPGRLWNQLSDFKNDFIKRFKHPGVSPREREQDPRYSHTIR